MADPVVYSDYQRISKFRISTIPKYHLQRPNSCEKPRNKKAKLVITNDHFSELPVINFSLTMSLNKTIKSRPSSASQPLKKYKLLSKPKKKPIVPAISFANILQKKNFTPHTSVKKTIKTPIMFKNKSLLDLFKKSLVEVKKNSIFC